MLEFKNEHKFVDLSSIYSKISNIGNKNRMIAGISLSALLILSGCSKDDTPPKMKAVLPVSYEIVDIKDVSNNIGSITYGISDDKEMSFDIDKTFFTWNVDEELISKFKSKKDESNIIINKENNKISDLYGLIRYNGISFIVEMENMESNYSVATFHLKDDSYIYIDLNDIVVLYKPTLEDLNNLKKIALSKSFSAEYNKENVIFKIDNGEIIIPVEDYSEGINWNNIITTAGSTYVIPENSIIKIINNSK